MKAWICVMTTLLSAATISTDAGGQSLAKGDATAPVYTVAFASFAPLNTDIFMATAAGNRAQPLFESSALDYNASLSPDVAWVVFTSERDGSAGTVEAPSRAGEGDPFTVGNCAVS